MEPTHSPTLPLEPPAVPPADAPPADAADATNVLDFQAARTVIEGAPKPAHKVGDTPPNPHPPGSRIGAYEVLRELGHGSMGVVLATKHVELGREAALKVLSPALVSDPESVERFRRESEAVARLDHPGIVRLYERGESNGTHFYAMELVPGTSLDNVIRRERVPYLEAARTIAQCAHAVDFAHSRGVLHRDIKPANILLDTSGHARLTDFGLARIDRKATLTSEGVVVGTPLYLAPEVAQGERATRKSDIYSLGATLYELATGRPPYEGRDARTVMMRVLNEPPIPPTDADPRVPRDLVRIVGRAMARNPEERYPNARAFALDLERFAQGRSLEIAGSTAAFRETSAKKAWKRFAIHASIVVGVATVFGVIFWMNVRLKNAEEEANRLAKELTKAKTKAAASGEEEPDLDVDLQGLHAAQDRDVRARLALRTLTADASDAAAKRSFDDLVARARGERDDPSLRAEHLRQAIQLFPHRWDEHVELAAALSVAEPDAAEAECSLCTVAPDASKEDKLAARLLRAKIYRDRNDALSLWLAATDLRLVIAARAPGSEGRAGLVADLAYALAGTGDLKAAEATLKEAGAPTGDESARVALARAALARAKNDPGAVDSELARAREAATSDETKRLVDAFAR